MKDLILRPERPGQYREMEQLVRDAFWDRFSPGCCEHLVVHRMRTAPACLPELCLAAELKGELAGGIWYARAALRQADGSETEVYTMGPVAVRPDLQKRGIGGELIRKTLELAEKRCCAVVIYGNPAYYGRFGFLPASEFGITDAMGEACPALQLRPFGEVPPGAFDEGEVYHVAPGEIRAFDSNFPHRQKHINSKQLFFTFPSPPPEDPLLKRSWELHCRAEQFLRNSGLLEAWEGIGAKIRCVGSFRADLMMKDRDIDLHVYSESLDFERAHDALKPFSTSPGAELTFIDNAGTAEKCLEWHLKMPDGSGELWTVDMIQLPAGSEWDGFFEDTAEAVIDALTPESRRRILELKAAEPDGMNVCGIEFCKAVLDDRVTSWQEFLKWRQSTPPETLLKWRPRCATP